VIEVGARRRAQPAPPHVLFQTLTAPDRDPARPWLVLLDDERPPDVVEARAPDRLVWSSLWPRRPDALIRFELPPAPDGGTDLRWALLVDEPAPSASLLGHLRRRLNQLVNANLRYSLGQ
jgi:hypothetical protein